MFVCALFAGKLKALLYCCVFCISHVSSFFECACSFFLIYILFVPSFVEFVCVFVCLSLCSNLGLLPSSLSQLSQCHFVCFARNFSFIICLDWYMCLLLHFLHAYHNKTKTIPTKIFDSFFFLCVVSLSLHVQTTDLVEIKIESRKLIGFLVGDTWTEQEKKTNDRK